MSVVSLGQVHSLVNQCSNPNVCTKRHTLSMLLFSPADKHFYGVFRGCNVLRRDSCLLAVLCACGNNTMVLVGRFPFPNAQE